MRTSGSCLTNARAQKTSVILNAYLTACQKIRYRGNRFFAASGAGTNCQDQITKGKATARFDNLAKFAISFHILPICSESRSDAIDRCE
jgi:hypothetical protein